MTYVAIENVRVTKNSIEQLVNGEWVLFGPIVRAKRASWTRSCLETKASCAFTRRESPLVVGGLTEGITRVGNDLWLNSSLVDPPADDVAARAQEDTDRCAMGDKRLKIRTVYRRVR